MASVPAARITPVMIKFEYKDLQQQTYKNSVKNKQKWSENAMLVGKY